MARRLRPKREYPQPQIMIVPLVDTLFVLLLFFMLVNRFLAPTINVDLPRSVSATITEEHSVQVAISADSTLYLGQTPVTWDNLVPALTSLKETENPEIVRIKSDKTVPIQTVVRVIDAVREAGLKTIALETGTREALEQAQGAGG